MSRKRVKLARRSRPSRVKAAGRFPRSRRALLIVGGLIGVSAVGLVAALLLGRPAGAGAAEGASIPSYAYNSATTLSAYRIAVRMPDALAVIPCYCGCGPGQGHTSLKDCFFLPDGSFTDHASNCHLCVEEAVDVGGWHDKGLALSTIRAWIEDKYSDHGPGTDTPPVG